MKKKGQITIYLVWIFTALVILMIGAFVAPAGALISTQFYQAGEDLLVQGNTTAGQINDPAVRTALQSAFSEAATQSVTNITVTTDLFQYSWALILVMSLLAVFLLTRKLVEYGRAGVI